MALRLRFYGEPVLRKKGDPVVAFDNALTQLVHEMIETMHAEGGIGLAAQQIGHPLQLCVVDLGPDAPDFDYELDGKRPPLDLIMPMALVNPVVTPQPESVDVMEEGCLSFPDIRGEIVRPDAIRVDYLDEQGRSHTLTCNGLLSRCIQHEVDHLNGILFIDRMASSCLQSIQKDLSKLKKQTRRSLKNLHL